MSTGIARCVIRCATMVLSLTSLLLFIQTFLFVSSYTLPEILEDSKTLPLHSLASYRGKILKDLWMRNAKPTHRNEHQVCRKLFEKSLQNVEIIWPPPKEPPNETFDAYTLGGRSHVKYRYRAERQNGGQGYNWDRRVFEGLRAKEDLGCGLYGVKHCSLVLQKFRKLVENKTAVVVGSQTPWAEAALFNVGASHVTTIEYMKITSNYPNYSALHPTEVAEKYLNNSWTPLDVAYSFSSLEHDGLGRYGDPLNPFGDFESLARIRCLLRPGGVMFFAVPVGPDSILWNLHRVYGRYRLGLILLGWKPLYIYPTNCNVDDINLSGDASCQPMIILQKSTSPSDHKN
jgi:hypothetical protein